MPFTMLLMLLSRLPMTAMGMTLTLHIVTELGRGYGAAGLVGTATTAGSAVGAPLLGRMIDRYGLRRVVVVCGAVSTAYWLSAAHLPYPGLLVIALPAGLLTVPASSIAKQVIAASVPSEYRRTAFAMDTISVEVSFMIGPASGIMITTQISSTVALTAVGAAFALVSCALYVLDPPVRGAEESRPGAEERISPRTWVTGRFVATLLIACGAMFVLIGTEVATLASLRSVGEVGWTGMVIVVMCCASLVGGVIHGAVRRSLSQLTLMVVLAVLAVPVGLFDQPWWLIALALIPTNLACAPTLAATTEQVSTVTPVAVRGEAMGLQDAATRLGLAVGNPAVGFVIDHSAPVWGFVAAGTGGLLFAFVGVFLQRRSLPHVEEPTVVRAKSSVRARR